MSHKRVTIVTNAAMIAHEMQGIVRRAAEPWQPGDKIKAAITRAAARTGIGYRRIRTLWYRQTEAITAFEADTLREWNRKYGERLARLDAERDLIVEKMQEGACPDGSH